jgi:hypothetical protein
MHFIPNQLSHVGNGEPAIRVEDQLPNVVFFLLTIDWYTPIKEYL